MADIDGGSLSFKSVLDNDQLNAAVDETLRRVQGLSNGVVSSGKVLDKTTQEMVECIQIQQNVVEELTATYNDLNAKINALEPGDAQDALMREAESVKQELDAERQGLVDLMNQLNSLQITNASCSQSFTQIREALAQIGSACEVHETALAGLEDEYEKLKKAMNDALMSGNDSEYNALKERASAIKGEIATRKSLLNELREQSDALENEASKLEESARQAEATANKHVTLRQRIRELKEEMASLIADGVSEQSEAYKELENELGRLVDIQGDVTQQGSVLANDEADFAGIIEGLSGVSGAFTAAQGAVALFAGENEDLQKIMLKVQSLMSITMGLQQAAQALNKDSAFQLVTLNKLKTFWNNLLAVGRGEQVASTAATVADTAATTANAAANTANTTSQASNTAAQGANTVATGANTVATGAQTVAATAGTAANIGLAGAFRMVGAAIKSIPVMGWIIAGITAIVAVLASFSKKANEAKKAAEEFSNAVVDGCYKPIGTVEELSEKWSALGDNMEDKKKFIEENKKVFDELGVSVQGVTDAENLLIANKDRFIAAQIAKAKASIYTEQATAKVKELLTAQDKLDKTPKAYVSKKGEYTDGYGVKRKGMTMVKDSDWQEAEDNVNKIQGEIDDLFQKAREATENGTNALKQAGIDAANTYKDGTLGAIEQAISTKQAALKTLTNNADYEKAMAEINALQKQADAIKGNKSGGTSGGKNGGGGSTTDAFAEKLNKYKAEYQRFNKWVNSGDEILVKSANQEFQGLLQQGATYIDYLKNQRDQILDVDVASRSKEQTKQLQQLNDAIAEETKQTVLEAFNNELNEQLTNAKTTLEILNIIEQKRKELSGDGTELDTAKSESLDEAEKDAKNKLKEETETLLEQYASYTEQKRQIDEAYQRDYEILMEKRKSATTDAERDEIDTAMSNRTKKRDTDTNSIGGLDYDSMLSAYGTFEQKKQAIIDQYDEKRKAAQATGNAEMIEAVEKAEAQALSKFALGELQANPDWEKMFGNLDEISTKKLQELIDKINNLDGAYLGIEFAPKDLESLKSKVEEMKNEIQERNPFKSLISSIKDYSKATDDESKKKALTSMFTSASKSIDLVKGTMDSVVSGMETMGITMDEETQAILGDIGGIMDGASQLSQGIASGNPLSVIQGSVSLISSAVDLFNSKDRKAEKAIKKHQEQINKLTREYAQLEWQIDKSLGSEVYSNQNAAIKNMEEQKEHLQAMYEAEDSKKKTDKDKLADYKEQIAELDRQIEDMYDDIAEDIVGTSAKDFATSLADSLTDAFAEGEDAAKAFEETVNDVLKNAIVNQLKKNFLEKQLQSALDNLQSNMGYWNGDDFIFDGLTDDEIADFKARVQAAANNYNEALSVYSDILKDVTTDDSDDSLTGAVKGVSEETASILAGQMNAIRINQLEATETLRQSLQALNTIAANTQYNRYLARIERIITILEGNSGDTLRAQGLS